MSNIVLDKQKILTELQELETKKHDVLTSLKKIEFTTNNNRILLNDSPITNWGIQVFTKNYTTIRPSTVEDLLQHQSIATINAAVELLNSCKINDDKNVILRFYDGVIRYIGSERYGILNNLQFLALVENLLDNELYEFHYDCDELEGKILLNNISLDDSDYKIGIYLRNSEVGKSIAKFSLFIYREICTNGLIISQNKYEYNKKHLGRMDLQKIYDNLYTILEQNNNMNNIINDINRTYPIENVDKIIITIGNQYNLRYSEIRSWREAFDIEPIDNSWGIINALTRAANYMQPIRKTELQEIAGQLVVENWNKFNELSKFVTDKQMLKIYRN